MSNRKKYLYRILAIVIAAVVIALCILYFIARGNEKNFPDEPTQTTEQAQQGTPQTTIPNSETGLPADSTVPPAEDVDWEDVPQSAPVGVGQYDNSRQVHFEFDANKNTVYVGLGQNKLSDALYLNLVGKMKKPLDAKVGYYIFADTGAIEFSNEEQYIDWNTDKPAAGNFAFVQRYYTDVRNIDYVDENNYGVCWKNDIWAGGVEGQGTTIHVRAISPENSMFLCAFAINVEYDNASGTYFIKSITPEDVSATGELNGSHRTDIVNEAVKFAEEYLVESKDGNKWQKAAAAGATVDKVVRPYFGNKLLCAIDNSTTGMKPKTTVSFFKDFPSCRDVYAITLPVSYYGYITLYAAPWYQIYMPSSNQAYLEDDDSDAMQLNIFAYDPLFPNSEQTMMVPSSWNGDING